MSGRGAVWELDGKPERKEERATGIYARNDEFQKRKGIYENSIKSAEEPRNNERDKIR